MLRRNLSIRLGDYRRCLLSATALLEDPVALLTVTGPGWDELERDPAAIREWNRTAAKRWGRLDRAAKSRLRKQGYRATPLFRIAQRQPRGVDHLHIGLEHDQAAVQAYAAALKELAPRYGFGYIDDPYRPRHPRGADGRPDRSKPKRDMVFRDPAVVGRYLVRYLSESNQLSAMLEAADYSFRPMWISPVLTQRSKVTCRRLRRLRHAWFVLEARSQGSRPTLPTWWADLSERMTVLSLLRPQLQPQGP